MVAATVASGACVAQATVAASGNTLQCLPSERIECGCALTLANVSCQSGPGISRRHLSSALSDGAPLWLSLDGRLMSVPSLRPASQTFSFARGHRWIERYQGHGLAITIEYMPGNSTCPKKGPETCEYFDVAATVHIQQGSSPPRTFRGTGVCGC